MSPVFLHIRLPCRLTTTAVLLSSLFMGCHFHESAECQRVPAVNTRFTANPLSPLCDATAVCLQPMQAPSIRVGLAMQSGPDPVHVQFASRLGTVMVRELQLSAGSFAVQPLDSLHLNTQTPAINTETPSDVITINFQDSQNTLPPPLPPSPLFLTPAPPLVDQILVVRVIEYRPYFPMLATLEIQVLDGETQDPMFATTVTWSGVDYRLAECRHNHSWRHKLFCHEPNCDPAAGHNSPQALMHEIASDISAWYNFAINPPIPIREKSMLTPGGWRRPFCR